MPLKVSDGMGAWIDDFAKSDAPQFKGKNKDERRDMAIAAYLSAKRGPEKENVSHDQAKDAKRSSEARIAAAAWKSSVRENIQKEARAPRMKYALVGAKDMKIYATNSDERDARMDRRSLEKRFNQPMKIARLKTAQKIGDKVDKSQIKENIEEATSRADMDRAMAAFKKRGGKINKLAPGKAAGYHGKDDPGKDMHGMMDRPDTKRFGTRKKVGSMRDSVMWEAIDPKIQRVKMLARLGLVGKSDVNKLMMAMKAIDDGKELNKQYRNIIFDAFNDLIDLVTGDTTVFQKAKKAVAKEEVVLEGKMNQLHMYMKQKKSAKEIAKLMKLDVKTIAALIGESTLYEADDKDPGEYDDEGIMMKDKLDIIMDACDEMYDIIEDDENLPEWVQDKVTKAADYIDSSRDYLMSQKKDNSDD